MNIVSLTYLAFLSLTLILYYLFPERFGPYVLLLASLAFYAYAMPRELLIMMAYIWVIFFTGLLMRKEKRRKFGLIFGIAISVAFLFAYKYLNFTLAFFTHRDKTFSIVVPIGISYITFQSIAYLAEICKGNVKVVEEPVHFFLYSLFFTKVTAGPIEPPAKFFAAIDKPRELTFSRMKRGVLLLCVGFAKKIAVADLLAPGISAVFDSSTGTDGLTALLATIMYSFQIYFDFSGYTDIARGSSVLFGIDLVENFKNPYFSNSVVEFWRRWHISLSTWLKNYIYIPLGGNRCSTARRYFNVFVTFLVSGIWHGASLTFIFWGLLHGVFQMVEMLLRPLHQKLRKLLHAGEDSLLLYLLGCIKTFILVSFAWIFFRAASLQSAANVIRSIFSPWGTWSDAMKVLLPDIRLAILVVVSMVITVALKRRSEKKKKINTVFAVIAGACMIWLIVSAYAFAPTNGGSSFIYFDF